MEHVLRLLKRHGFTETVVTVQFLAALIRNYFGDGEELGMSLSYATEEIPLGPLLQRQERRGALRDDRFLVISGDALTDIDLTDMVRFHKENDALVTIGLKRVPNPSSSASSSWTTRAACSGSWRSRRGARCSPTPSTPAST